MSNEKKLPDWSAAPSWATHRAIDADGVLYYYSSEPKLGDVTWRYGAYVYGQKYFAGHTDPTNWQNSLERRPEPQTNNEPPQINQPVNDEWFVLMGFQFHKKSETFIIPAMRGGYNYDIEVNEQFIALRDIEKEIVTVLHDTTYHGAITQEKVLHTLMLFN